MDPNAKSRRRYIHMSRAVLALLSLSGLGLFILCASGIPRLEREREKLAAARDNPALDPRKVEAARKDVESRIASSGSIRILSAGMLACFAGCLIWSFFKPKLAFALAFCVYIATLGVGLAFGPEKPDAIIAVGFVFGGGLFVGAKSAWEEETLTAAKLG
jgi:hypothetical protein